MEDETVGKLKENLFAEYYGNLEIRIPSYKTLTESMTTIIVRLLESSLHSSTYRDHFKLQPLFGQVLVEFPKLTSFKHTMSSLMFHSGEFHQRNPIYLTL